MPKELSGYNLQNSLYPDILNQQRKLGQKIMFRFITEKRGWKVRRFLNDVINFYSLGLGIGRPIPFRARYPEYK